MEVGSKELIFCYECVKKKDCNHQYVCGIITCNEAEKISKTKS